MEPQANSPARRRSPRARADCWPHGDVAIATAYTTAAAGTNPHGPGRSGAPGHLQLQEVCRQD